MASLTHVCMWSEHGWTRVTAEEASAMHPGGTVSAHSGLFMCELCGQYVTLTDGYIRDRYFKHSAYEANKTCPERTFGSAYIPSYGAGEHDLPIKILPLGSSGFKLELGLLSVPDKLLKKQEKKQISIITDNGREFIYSFERLNYGKLTYVSVGNEPSSVYTLSVNNQLSAYWPSKVDGISKKGSLFDASTGKKLPIDADVQIEKKYYLLTTTSYYEANYVSSKLKLSLVCYQRVERLTWKVYEVEALELNEIAAKFFLDIHCRLTDSPMELMPIWPIHIETPYVIKYNQSEMIFHMSGGRQLNTKSFPYARVSTIKCAGSRSGQVIKVESNNRQQLISAGESNVLEYLYLWKEPLNKSYSHIKVVVKDEQGQVIKGGIYTVLPQNTRLNIEVAVDGLILCLREKTIIEKIKITAGDRFVLQDIHFGMTYQVVQGLDIVWSATYLKPKRVDLEEDKAIYMKLISFKGKEITIDHSIGGLAMELKDYPRVKKWLLMVVKKGHVSLAAIKYLKKILTRLEVAGGHTYE